MRVENLPASLTQPRAEAAPKTGKDEFLKLLVAQLQHQNPLDPQDGAEFVAQLAQFTSLEQSAETNKRLESLEAGQDIASRAALVGLTGRGVTAYASQIAYDPSRGPVPDLSVSLGKSAGSVSVSILNADGALVRRIDLGATSAGETALNWDGKDGNGRAVAAGNYSLKVEAKDPNGLPIVGDVHLQGNITAVSFEHGGTAFQVGSVSIAPSDIASLDGAVTEIPVTQMSPQPAQ